MTTISINYAFVLNMMLFLNLVTFRKVCLMQAFTLFQIETKQQTLKYNGCHQTIFFSWKT